MGAQLDVSEAVALASRIQSNAGRVGAQASAVLRKTAFDIEADAKHYAPVDTGNLQGSISTTISGDGRMGAMTAEIGPTAEYGPYVEFGTSVMPGQPYMTPAADRRLPPFTEAIAQLGEQLL